MTLGLAGAFFADDFEDFAAGDDLEGFAAGVDLESLTAGDGFAAGDDFSFLASVEVFAVVSSESLDVFCLKFTMLL